jgi:peptidoglycan/xylan/chitin deacetylase (PgdA/CDA1 family)
MEEKVIDKKELEVAKPHSKIKFILWILLGIVLFAALLCYLFIPRFIIRGFDRNITLIYGAPYAEDYGTICYGNIINCADVTVESDIKEIDTYVLGENVISYHITNVDGISIDLTQKITVVDEDRPDIMTNADTITVCPNNQKIILPSDLKIIDNRDGDITEKAEIKYENDKVSIYIADELGNSGTRTFPANVSDTTAPVWQTTLKSSYEIVAGETLSFTTPIAIDECDGEITAVASGTIDTNTVGDYHVDYTATDSQGNTATMPVDVKVLSRNGIIYLTFDDGPSPETSRLLDVLKAYGVKATFFVTGAGGEDILQRECNEGHSIGLHTFSHSYDYVYQSVDIFFSDIEKVKNRVESYTDCTSTLIRFPGGSSNTVSRGVDGGTHIMSKLVEEVPRRGYAYFDWNVSSGDAGGAYMADQVFYNVVNNLKPDVSVVLQHDTRAFSVDAVERIIQYGLSHGYRFMPLTHNSFGAHHGVNN